MSKFCGKCGGEINENGLCPNCDVMHNAVTTENITVPSTENPTKTKKKSKKPIVIISIILGVLVLAGGTLFALWHFGVFGGAKVKNDSPIVFEHNGTEYFVIYSDIIPLNNDEILEPVEAEDDKNIAINYNNYIYDSGAFYYMDYVDNCIYKSTFIDEYTIKREKCLGTEILEDLGIYKEIPYIYMFNNWHTDGDYIYFNYTLSNPNNPGWNEVYDDIYKIGRINIENKSAEFLGDTKASSYIVHDGYIYYFDNGIKVDENGYVQPDANRVGIYKMKCDGTNKELLYDDFNLPNIYEYSYHLGYNICEQFQICGDYLYFIHSEDEFIADEADIGYNIFRMKLDGSDFECVSEEDALTFTFDEKGKKLYYLQPEKAEEKTDFTVYELNLSSGKEKGLFDYNEYCNQDIEMQCYNGYLYISTTVLGMDPEPSQSAFKYDIKKDKLHTLYGYQLPPSIEIDPETMAHVTRVGEGPFYYWEEE